MLICYIYFVILNINLIYISESLIVQRVKMLRKNAINSATKMLRPLWNVNSNKELCSTLGWRQTDVGKTYQFLFPNDLHMTKTCGLQEAIVDNFEAGMATINFHNCLHLDEHDKNELSHCSFFPPLKKEGDKKLSNKKCVFSTGSIAVDISGEPVRISFLPEQVYHGTSEPINNSSCPEILKGMKSSKSILDNKKMLFDFLSESMLAWGTWSHYRSTGRKNIEWNKCVEGIHDEEEKKKIRTELVNGKWPSEMLCSKNTKSKKRRKMYKRSDTYCI